MARRFLGGAIRRQSRVGIGSDILGRQRLRQLDQGALAREQVLRITAVGVDAGERTVQRMHIIASTARQTMTAGYQWMTNTAVASRNALDPGSDRLDPARILMAHDVGKLDVNLAAPNAFDDM